MTRKRSAWVLMAAVVSLLAAALGIQPAGGVAVPTPQSGPWSGYATASALHINAAQTSATALLADSTVAFSGASVNTAGQGTPINNEMGLAVQPVNGDREAYGRGSGLEVGVQRTLPINPDSNQVIVPSALSEAGATPPAPAGPNAFQSALVSRELTRQTVAPVAFASVLRGQAMATFNDRFVMPMLGQPLGFGLGYADDVQLLAQGSAPALEGFAAPLVATNTAVRSAQRTTSQSLSINYLVNNGDGTCGLASETRLTIAPIRLNLPPDTNPDNDFTIEVLGEYILRAVATGKPGGSSLRFAPADETRTPRTPVVRVFQGQNILTQVFTQDLPLFGPTGLVIEPAQAVFSVAVAEDPRGIATTNADPVETTQPTITDTDVAGALDIVRVRVLQPTPTVSGQNLLDFRLGHFESRVSVPAGGINCEIPVLKTVDKDPAMAGEDLTFTIAIPRDASALVPFPCELTNIRVVDTVAIDEGEPRFQVVGGTGPNGEQGVVDGDTITFPNIGNYRVGDPPLLVQVVVRILPDSGIGRLRDTVSVSAQPANCRATSEAVGRALGAGFFGAGGARLTGAGLEGAGGGRVTGTGELGAPNVTPAPVLPKTGGSDLPAAAVAAGGLALILGIRQVNRRRQEA